MDKTIQTKKKERKKKNKKKKKKVFHMGGLLTDVSGMWSDW